MISKCANPKCEIEFHYLRGGRLYRFDLRRPKKSSPNVPNAILAKNPSKTTVYFWLCEQCCQANMVQFSMKEGMRVVPIARSPLRFSTVVVNAAENEMNCSGGKEGPLIQEVSVDTKKEQRHE